MRCLQSLLLFSLVFAVHCRPSSEADQTRQVKSEEKRVSRFNKKRAKLAAYKNQLDSYKNQLDSINNRLDANKNGLDNQADSINDRLDAYENRLDNQADSVNNRLESYENKLDNQADSYKNQVDSYVNQFDAYKNQFDSYKNQMDAYKNQMDAYKNQFDSYKSQLDSYKSQVDSIDTHLQVLQRKEDAAVAFTARIAANLDSTDYGKGLAHHTKVVFGDVLTNIGDAYNPTTGIFTAPVNGTYVFFLNQMNPNKRPHLYLAIVKNGAALGVVFAKGHPEASDQGSSQVNTHLTAGDQVWVRQHGGGTGVRASWWTVFTGFLLHAE